MGVRRNRVCIRDKIPSSFSQLCAAFPGIRHNCVVPSCLVYSTDVGLTANEVRNKYVLTRYLWRTKWHWERFLSEYFAFDSKNLLSRFRL
jgi:hypothetical protein